MQKSIGNELKIIRIRNNLRLEDVADSLNINRETLRRYENNSSGLSIEKLEGLLDFYKVDKAIFFENVCANMHNNSNVNVNEKEE